MKSCSQPCKNRTTRKTGQTGCVGSRLPFSAARETPCGFLPALFRNEKTVIQTGLCTFALHSSYTAIMRPFRSCRMNNF
jgi:hypothetical protein